ncbi:NUMOD4 motif-containing HNH endonuclease [Corynebacterium sp. AOP34-AQ2-28]|uniref:NUMOD4 motif-containing HNH endonuclease n=1 Tax=Corynebacterium sp. AOP34-AQ2-28 TaxID=3457689 RepID=UPI004034F064
MTSERWLPVTGYGGIYEVSDQGRVRSLSRVVSTRKGDRRYRGKTLAPKSNRHGYPLVVLADGGVLRSKRVHRLVLEAFVGPCPEGMEACHNNGDRGDPRLANLRWDSASENQRDRRRHGTDYQANKTHCPAGHPYDAENMKVIPSRPTARYCKACHKARSTNRKAA